MASWVSSFLQYLGLAPDEDYPEYEEYEEPVPQGATTNGPIRTTGPDRSVSDSETGASVGSVRPMTADAESPAGGSSGSGSSSGLSTAAGVTAATAATAPAAGNSSVVPLPTPRSSEPRFLTPSSFGQAQEVADHFKDDHAVALELSSVDADLARRLIDFSSGLCYALGGKMEKLEHQLFLLIPAEVSVSSEDRRRLTDRVAT